ncbi:hypothetical protein AJ87_04845 [Rhizobium yanglingense]|nr:hypothetical protein AJ87_04845 [Rhizobium yanglingense]
MPAEAAIDDRCRDKLFRAARIHIAREEEDAGDAVRMLIGKDECRAGAITPADERCFGEL